MDPVEHEFPFEVPADLTALSAEEFAAFAASVRTYAQTTVADDTATPAALTATRDLFNAVTAEDTRRTEQAAAATAAREELAAGLVPPAAAPATAPAPAPEPEPVPAPEPTGNPPVPAVVATSTSTIDTPPAVEPQRYATMVASSDAANSGQELTSFSQVGQLIERRLARYSTSPGGKFDASRALGNSRFKLGDRTVTRHANVAFQREFPAELRIRSEKDVERVLDYATDERRLEGGSLINAVTASVNRGASLTAAVGWCAPSETIYDLCELETMDGMLDIAEVQATRGGFFVPEDGGPNFSVIYDSIGDEGDVILTEYDVENGIEKVCVEIPCPDFVEVRLDVAYICITGSLLQRRGYPEAVSRFSRGAMVESLSEDYVRTARSKGLPTRNVVYKHALRSALVPIVTIFGIDFAFLLSGTLITEQIFDIQGIGKWSLDATFDKDLPVVQATVVFAAIIIVVANIMVDILYSVLDPRVRLT